MPKECSERSNELVLNEFEKLTIIAKEETKKAVEYLSGLAKKKKKKDEISESNN